MLMREGFPPALLPQEWRTGYMHGLHLAQTSDNHTPICNLIGRAVEQALDRYLESIEASDAIPLPLSEVAERTGTVPSTWPGLSARVAYRPSSATGAGSPALRPSSATVRRSKARRFHAAARPRKHERSSGA
jgi:hypothetical protein